MRERKENNFYILCSMVGLEAIAERESVTLEEAAELAKQDIIEGGGIEHLASVDKALEELLKKQSPV